MLQIPVVADLPVGNNLQVPVGFIGAEYVIKEPIASTEFKASSLLAKIDYFLFGTGKKFVNFSTGNYMLQPAQQLVFIFQPWKLQLYIVHLQPHRETVF
jgi:hypothetical protein